MIDLKPVTVLRGVGESLAARLRALGVETTQDLLFLLPLRYEDRTRIVPLGELRPGQRASVEGEVLLTEVAFRGRRQMLCRIADGSGFLTLRFFYFTAQQQQGLARGARVRCFGEARRGAKGLEFVHPEYRRMDPNAPQPPEEHLTPIYPDDGRRDPGTAATAGQIGAGPDCAPKTRKIGCRRPCSPIRACPRCAMHCCTCTGRPPTHRWIC